jgi:hypothetical protein
MIKLRKHTIVYEPRLPSMARDELESTYPADEPIPKVKWAVTFQCGEYGGSYGYGETLKEALENAAKEGWSPIKQYSVKLCWDRHFDRNNHSPVSIVTPRKWESIQKTVDTILEEFGKLMSGFQTLDGLKHARFLR